MPLHLHQVVITVKDYDAAIQFYVNTLGFTLLEDTDMGGGKRWVRVSPSGNPREACFLLARAVNPRQEASVGNQTGGRVFIFLHTDDFARDHQAFVARGVRFTGPPREEAYGTVAVFEDLYGNLIDLIQPRR